MNADSVEITKVQDFTDTQRKKVNQKRKWLLQSFALFVASATGGSN